MNAAVISRRYEAPIPGWAPNIGLVTITGERELFGHVFQREIIVLATGRRGVADARVVIEYEGQNILPFIPAARGQTDLFS